MAVYALYFKFSVNGEKKMKKDNPTNQDVFKKTANGEGALTEAECYEQAKQILEASSENLALYKKAQELLEQISGYKNSAKLLQECNDKILAINLKKDMAKRKKKKTIRNAILGVAVVVVALLVASAVSTQKSADQAKYEAALEALEEAETNTALTKKERDKKYKNAYKTLAELGYVEEVFNNRIHRVKLMADNGQYAEAFSFISTDIRKQEGVILTQANELAIDEAETYVKSKILVDADAKLEAKNFYAALDLYRYLDVNDPAIAEKVEKCQTESIKTSNVGDIVRFGTYEVNCETGDFDEDVEWIVVAKDGNKFLLVSKYILDTNAFNSTYSTVTWENSSIRSWLNGAFTAKMFNEDELSRLTATEIETNGKKTTDKVFLLSKAEAEKYLGGKLASVENSAYAVLRGVSSVEVEEEVGGKDITTYFSAGWWLRDTYEVDLAETTAKASNVLTVTYDGAISENGHAASQSGIGVRPAIWVTID